MIRWRFQLIVLACLLLSGCNPFAAPDSMVDAYVQRLGRVLEVDVTLSEPPSVVRFPRRRDRVLEMPELDMNLLDFLSLYGCQLQYVVGEKNSIMGRVMQPLNRLRYERAFIRAAGDCLPTLDDKTLVKRLQKAVASKQSSLPIAVWNATWGVEEAESLLTFAKGDLPIKPETNALARSASDLAFLDQTVAELLGGDLTVSLERVGRVHQHWLSDHSAGQAINSARQLVARLQDATRLIDRRLEQRPLCLDDKPSAGFPAVKGVFFNVYVEKVQPYLSRVQRARNSVIGPLRRLAEQQASVMPDAFLRFYQTDLAEDGSRSLWRQLDLAIDAHTKAWQRLLGQCGQRPSA